ncbi:hypothetical protein VMCG_06355 [Cytospora schulzeri]|uniref:Uncharacterized protein n=1 Tax=Cytospora schulzeri TaxID=448051 RepID=A0A423W899_9PEZI|nr:hypothetical protein VMCG_06355 [Valsa malicola]
MGLGAKIKEALHGDHHDQATSDVKAPGAYPDDEPSQRHSDGKEYNAQHGDLINKKWDTTGPAGTSDRTHTGAGDTSASGHSGNLMGSSGSPRNKLHRDTDDYHPVQEAYSQPTHDHHTRDSGVGLGHQTSTKDDTPQGAYWGDLPSEGHHGHGNTDGLTDRTYRGQDHTGAGRGDHNPRFEDQAVGGGVYNSVTGAGSPDHSGSRGKHHTSGGAVHDSFTSGTQGAGIPSGNTYDQTTDHHGRGIPTSRKEHTGGGLVGAGAGAAAGYGANDYAHRGHDNAGYNPSHDSAVRDTHAPGVPHSTLLNGRIFTRLAISAQTEPAQLAAALKESPKVGDGFCLSHRNSILIFDGEVDGGGDLKDTHHEHVRAVCLALKDADMSLTISGCIFDAEEVLKAGFQLDALSRGSVMVVDLMSEDDDDSDDSGDDEDAEAYLMGGETGGVVS